MRTIKPIKEYNLLKSYAMKTIATIILLIAVTFSYSTEAIRLKISGTKYSDESIVRFISGATNGFDNDYDAAKLFSPNKQVPAIYTIADTTQPLCVNSYPLLTNGGIQTNVYIRNYVAATYTISCEEFGPISPSTCIYMEDVTTGSFYNLRSGVSYSFQLPVDSISQNPHYIIHISIPSTVNTSAASCSKSNDGSILVSKPGMGVWGYELFNTSGNVVKTGSNLNSTAAITGLLPGSYSLAVLTKYGCSENFTINIPSGDSPVASFFPSADSVYLSEGASVQFTNQSVLATKYKWDFGDLSLDSLSPDPMHIYADAGVYVVNLIAMNGGCSDTSSKSIRVLPPPSGVTTGIAAGESSRKIKAYNLQGKLMVSLPLDAGQSYEVSLFNTLGQLLYNEKIKSPAENYFFPHIDSSNTVLIVQVSSAGEIFSERIFVGE